jgi:hypothetical protein
MVERATSWQCPACGRQVPIYVETCRCGVLRELALPGVEFDRGAGGRGSSAGAGGSWAHRLCGYRPGVKATIPLRLFFGVFVVSSLALAGGAVLTALNRSSGGDTRDVTILARLEDYTRAQAPTVSDTIPGFLQLPGDLGWVAHAPDIPVALQGAPPPAEVTDEGRRDLVAFGTITPLPEVELRKGFCTPTLATYVRQRFPGSYDAFSDADLEKRVLVKYPEYKERRCELPAWIGAGPHEIVKFEPPNGSTDSRSPSLIVWVAALLLFELFGLNVYYRLLVPRFS